MCIFFVEILIFYIIINKTKDFTNKKNMLIAYLLHWILEYWPYTVGLEKGGKPNDVWKMCPKGVFLLLTLIGTHTSQFRGHAGLSTIVDISPVYKKSL